MGSAFLVTGFLCLPPLPVYIYAAAPVRVITFGWTSHLHPSATTLPYITFRTDMATTCAGPISLQPLTHYLLHTTPILSTHLPQAATLALAVCLPHITNMPACLLTAPPHGWLPFTVQHMGTLVGCYIVGSPTTVRLHIHWVPTAAPPHPLLPGPITGEGKGPPHYLTPCLLTTCLSSTMEDNKDSKHTFIPLQLSHTSTTYCTNIPYLLYILPHHTVCMATFSRIYHFVRHTRLLYCAVRLYAHK